ncbi:MAG TPA: sulfate adenylyltransferase subunit CysD [Bacteroidales bacterium]|nr:sulfate adenylyltransferase subunit CysD [Bacteroidales bacterium]
MINQSTHISDLESEAIFVIRETAAQFTNPVLLFSGGKDSLVMLHITLKAFWPAKSPFTLLHIDTGHNFPETLEFRDRMVKKTGARLMVAYVQDTIDSGRATEETGYHASRNALQQITLLDTIEKFSIDAALAGSRRDEEKLNAKERFFSIRDKSGHWDPKNQRAEFWNIFNGKKNQGEHFRIFPLSNWTEMDVWQYILRENIELPSLYFSHDRECFIRDGVIFAWADFIKLKAGEQLQTLHVRFRTIGDITCSGASLSTAKNIGDIIKELQITHDAERGHRSDDKRSVTTPEDRKKEGYF